ncbi:hypothetical protein EYF80_026099 [Liparis tanakae]|uniref:Uncharacterized protein n=1 Tax=Liparis tanakae TaxID=230148 RepID=A0A4Z2HDH8_9TELE|nr:hypothetical protein EYF80_026099 [Liparis tanakae]
MLFSLSSKATPAATALPVSPYIRYRTAMKALPQRVLIHHLLRGKATWNKAGLHWENVWDRTATGDKVGCGGRQQVERQPVSSPAAGLVTRLVRWGPVNSSFAAGGPASGTGLTGQLSATIWTQSEQNQLSKLKRMTSHLLEWVARFQPPAGHEQPVIPVQSPGYSQEWDLVNDSAPTDWAVVTQPWSLPDNPVHSSFFDNTVIREIEKRMDLHVTVRPEPPLLLHKLPQIVSRKLRSLATPVPVEHRKERYGTAGRTRWAQLGSRWALTSR